MQSLRHRFGTHSAHVAELISKDAIAEKSNHLIIDPRPLTLQLAIACLLPVLDLLTSLPP